MQNSVIKTVDLYHLDPAHNADIFCCRITERAFLKKRRVRIHARDSAHAALLDTMLWTFRSESFVPHAIGDAHISDIPVVIDTSSESIGDDVLINFQDVIPPFFTQYRHICDLIVCNADNRSAIGTQKQMQYENTPNTTVHIH